MIFHSPIVLLYSRGDNESDYLHKSVIPTMHFQKSLPRLAIPKLEDTIERYLTSQKPLLDSEQYMKTKDIAENFLGYEGRGKVLFSLRIQCSLRIQ